ncbi:hypothetical protein BG011_000269 [Mortierella polycephala]|uniref:BZIP domain-containing protein n=1 Tax=Mortierella polycephala TaxID=41804 RepID=A0A9P6PMJ6_9FUNG|nr:hypothetical protein BG011_000269 [Mortierella polycephala]
MTTVGTLSTDIGPGNSDLTGKATTGMAMAPSNTVPLIVTTTSDEEKADKLAVAPINGGFMQACSKLDMEPNPFEQSFSGVSSDKADVTKNMKVETPKPVLPPIASMSGRLAPNSEQFGWDAQSLRMGPLSPSMLEGPQDPIIFEEPRTNPAPVGSFPATTTPISTIFTSAAPASDSGFPFAAMSGPPMAPPPVTSAQTSEPYPPAVYNQQSAGPRSSQSHTNTRNMASQGAPHSENVNTYGNLHLLSQAQATHREMWNQRENVNANGHGPSQSYSGAGPNGNGMLGRSSAPNQRNAAPQRDTRMTSEDHSDDSEDSRNSSSGGDNKTKNNNKRSASDEKMDEEEKRKNFLERNRQAALKCRQRKKQWLINLQAKVEYLTTDNEHLQSQTVAMQDEIIHLKALLLAHKDCPVAQANGVYPDSIGGSRNHNGGMRSHQRASLPPPPPSQMQTGGPRMSVSNAPGSVAPPANVNGRPMTMM